MQQRQEHTHIVLILRHDLRVRPQPLGIPKTQPPQPLVVVAAAAVVRRPVPPGGLTLDNIRDYTDDEFGAELRELGLYRGDISYV